MGVRAALLRAVLSNHPQVRITGSVIPARVTYSAYSVSRLAYSVSRDLLAAYIGGAPNLAGNYPPHFHCLRR
jgi:hypothetical protein